MAKSADLSFLREISLLQDLEEPQLVALWPRLRERRLRKSEVLFREGDPGEEMFFIRTGTILVSKVVSGRVEQILSRLQAGDVFGEMSVFGRSCRWTGRASTSSSRPIRRMPPVSSSSSWSC